MSSLSEEKRDQGTAAEAASVRKYTCPVCPSSFKRPEHLKRHRRGHDSNKKFGCPVCGKGFVRSDIRSRHLAVHAGHARRKGPANKGRACLECAKARDWCSREIPCLRCTAKGLCCKYPEDSRPRSAKSAPLISAIDTQIKQGLPLARTLGSNAPRRASYNDENIHVRNEERLHNHRPLLTLPLSPHPLQSEAGAVSPYNYPHSPLAVSPLEQTESSPLQYMREASSLARRDHLRPSSLPREAPPHGDLTYSPFHSPNFVPATAYSSPQRLFDAHSFHTDGYCNQDGHRHEYSETQRSLRSSTGVILGQADSSNSLRPVNRYGLTPIHAEIDPLNDYPEIHLTEPMHTPLHTPVSDRGVHYWETYKGYGQTQLLSPQATSPTLSQATAQSEESEPQFSLQLYGGNSEHQYRHQHQQCYSLQRPHARSVDLEAYEMIAKKYRGLWYDGGDKLSLLSTTTTTTPAAAAAASSSSSSFDDGGLRTPQPQVANQDDYFLALYFEQMKNYRDDPVSFGVPDGVSTYVENPFG